MKSEKRVGVCLSPVLLDARLSGRIVVVVDILRATTTICTALFYGVKSIIPVATEEEALKWKREGCWVAAERDGKILDFADFGNSAFTFMNDNLKGKNVVYKTTNGTEAILKGSASGKVIAGAFVNLSVLTDYLCQAEQEVLILCSGWKGGFCLEDTLFAGLLLSRLKDSGDFVAEGDATLMAMDMWKIASTDVMKYMEKAEHRKRLKDLGLDDILDYSFSLDKAPVIPVFRDGKIVLDT